MRLPTPNSAGRTGGRTGFLSGISYRRAPAGRGRRAGKPAHKRRMRFPFDFPAFARLAASARFDRRETRRPPPQPREQALAEAHLRERLFSDVSVQCWASARVTISPASCWAGRSLSTVDRGARARSVASVSGHGDRPLVPSATPLSSSRPGVGGRAAGLRPNRERARTPQQFRFPPSCACSPP